MKVIEESSQSNEPSDKASQSPAASLISTLNEYHAAPPVLGFGISAPQQVKEALADGASGAISGSAVVKIIENNLNNSEKMLTELNTFVSSMKAATR